VQLYTEGLTKGSSSKALGLAQNLSSREKPGKIAKSDEKQPER